MNAPYKPGEERKERMAVEQLWVLAFDPKTGERAKIVCCPKGAAAAHAAILEMEGFDVRVHTQKEVDEMVGSESTGRE